MRATERTEAQALKLTDDIRKALEVLEDLGLNHSITSYENEALGKAEVALTTMQGMATDSLVVIQTRKHMQREGREQREGKLNTGRDLIAEGRRFCYWVPCETDQGQYRPSIVIENESGHFPLDYTWGSNYELAQQAADAKNKQGGLTMTDVETIIASSMARSDVWTRNRS